MDISIKHSDGVGVVSIKGELDAKSAPELTNFLNSQLSDGTINFVVDLEGLVYSSSAGIRIFLGSARDSRQKGGDLRIASVQPQVDKIFKLSKFDRIVKVFSNVDEAVQSYKDQR